ncbi:GNAT family N-acetyltransferase [Malaciobacter canalis]|uniref:GNAT family N-acetyltransferase n=1 Tax=Malaciobacter canalis TaxID=1912871 RepID=A0ABX4LME2_9BACT|nr:N-acetyltransferase [Malaciobacter canalis]PHO09030.1 GNAT family N-acetyltransferase [Malaciobacter canalis]QEE32321.1 ribosomal-protein-S18-alanine N-acetyltransferase [Malaciobacter canalis]
MIQIARKKDLNDIFIIEQNVFKDDIFSLSKACLNYHINKNIVFKVIYENKTIGYCLWLKRKSYYRLYSFAILKEYQGKGFASKLLSFSIEKLKDKSHQLEVKQSNEKAILLYEKFGFKKYKILENYYKKENGYLMRRV